VLLLDSQRTASARAKTYCDLFVLSKQDLGEVLKSFPEQRPVLQAMAETRIGRTALPFFACRLEG
jgi:CRP-like cAMP-binding protein